MNSSFVLCERQINVKSILKHVYVDDNVDGVQLNHPQAKWFLNYFEFSGRIWSYNFSANITNMQWYLVSISLINCINDQKISYLLWILMNVENNVISFKFDEHSFNTDSSTDIQASHCLESCGEVFKFAEDDSSLWRKM